MKRSLEMLLIGLVLVLPVSASRAEDSPKKDATKKEATAKEDVKKEDVKNEDAKKEEAAAEKKPAAPAIDKEALKASLKELGAIDREIQAAERKLVELKRKAESKKLKATPAELLDFAEANATDAATIDIAILLLGDIEQIGQKDVRRFVKLLASVGQNHAKNPDVAPLVSRIVKMQIGSKEIHSLFTNVAEQGKDPVALSWALWGLVQFAENEGTEEPEQSAKLEQLVERLLKVAPATEADLPLEKAKELLFTLQKLGVGKTAPEVISKTLTGKEEKLSDYKGKVVVLDFWATWCPHCIEMVPDERELVSEMKGKPFALISISADEDVETVEKYLKNPKNAMPWNHWFAGHGGIVKEWNVHSFPTIYVLDAQGVIRYRNVRGKELDAAVAKLVKEAEAKK